MNDIKKILSVIFILTLSICALSNEAEASTKKQAITLIDLCVYSSESTSSKTRGYIKEDSKISVVKIKSGWSEIKYKKKKSFIQTKYLLFEKIPKNPSVKIIKEIGNPPAKNKSYKFKEGGRLLSVDLAKLKNVKFFETFNEPLLHWQMNKIKEAIGSKKNTDTTSINFVSTNSLDNYSFIDAMLEDSMEAENDPNGYKGLRIYYVSSNKLMAPQAEYILKFILKPYLPTGYKSLAEEYVSGDRYRTLMSDKEWRKIDGKNVRIIFGFGSGEIQIAQKYKSKNTIF